MKLAMQTVWPYLLVPVVVLADQVTKWLVLAEPRLSATVIQTVGVKGYDGLTIALVISD